MYASKGGGSNDLQNRGRFRGRTAVAYGLCFDRKGTSQSILITTPPTTGANCTLASKEGNWTVVSPGSVTVSKSKENITVTCIKPGFQDGVASIPSNFEGWTVGNLLIGGVIGLGVDAATGAINDYPDAFQVPMTPIPGMTPVLSPQAQNTPPNS